MSDEFDRASELETMQRELAIKKASSVNKMPDIGQCYYCSEYTPPGHRFCDSECRDGFEAEMAAKRRNG